MKKKHQIKTISDIKYCEEHGIELYDDYQPSVCFKFIDGVWCSYTNKNLNVYNVRLSLNSLYYEEESEEQEATEKDIGKLCWFWDNEERKYISKLTNIYRSVSFPFEDCSFEDTWKHCRPLTKAEIQEFMEKAE